MPFCYHSLLVDEAQAAWKAASPIPPKEIYAFWVYHHWKFKGRERHQQAELISAEHSQVRDHCTLHTYSEILV
jgi:hypothetical protein